MPRKPKPSKTEQALREMAQEHVEFTPAGVLLLLKKSPRTTKELAQHFVRQEHEVTAVLGELHESGYLVSLMGDKWQITRTPEIAAIDHSFESDKDGWYRFGFCSDQHLGSKYSRLDVLADVYRRFQDEGISRVYNSGNWIDGECRFNKHELLIHGMDDQLDYLVEHYPSIPGITTYAVAGDDHEGWYSQREGVDIGKHAFSRMRDAGRDDWVDLGYMECFVDLVHKVTKRVSKMCVMHPGGGSAYATCFDEAAEILTRDRGWQKFADLQSTDEVATMTQEGHVFQWQRPTDIISEDYEGDLIRFKNRVYDFRVTPNHRLWTKRKNLNRMDPSELTHPTKSHLRHPASWHFLTAEEVEQDYGRQRFQFETACSDWEGENNDTYDVPFREPKKYASTEIHHLGTQRMEDIAELVGWYVTEGSMDRGQISISQSDVANPENVERISALLDRMGLKSSYSAGKEFVISSVELQEWLESECGKGFEHKRIPAWLKNQAKSILEILLDTCIRGDGWSHGASHGYRTVSMGLGTDVGEIAQKCGFGVTYKYREPSAPNPETKSFTSRLPYVDVGIRALQNEPSQNTPPTREFYKGKVYCCSVPNELIYVRCDGKAFWSGNSYKPQKIIESFSGGEKPAVLLIGHYHKISYNIFRNVHAVQCGTTEDQTPFMRKRQIHADVGAGICELHQDAETGAVDKCRIEFWTYFVEGYYNNRWKRGGDVTFAKRV